MREFATAQEALDYASAGSGDVPDDAGFVVVVSDGSPAPTQIADIEHLRVMGFTVLWRTNNAPSTKPPSCFNPHCELPAGHASAHEFKLRVRR